MGESSARALGGAGEESDKHPEGCRGLTASTMLPMTELPTGTVTFLFTDIEGSPRVLQELGEGYRAVQDRHAEILRAAFGARDGREVRTEGDSFFAVFRTPAQAVAAAVAAQRALAEEKWPHGGLLRVRMGLHTGEGVLGGDDYIGIDVNRAARIAAAGHGGQILISEATRALVEHILPDGVPIRDLGTHRLKDIHHAERLFDLAIERLQAEFPPPRTLDARPNNLPHQLTTFIGRREAIDETEQLLSDHRLVTLTGPGGSGKTRLALEVAGNLLPSLPDGAFFVDLTPIADPGQVCPAICQVLGVREEPGSDLIDTLVDRLAGQRLLLLLDNFEHLLPAADLIDRVLKAVAETRILVTSRTSLGLYGEQEQSVPPLDLPDPDGLGEATALPRYDAVAVFVGGIDLDAAEAVANPGGDLGIDTLDGLASLIDKSLLRRIEGAGGEPRFGMLETIREYARRRLEEEGEAKATLHRHAEYFLDLADASEPYLTGPDQAPWLDRVEREHENLQAALRWSAERGDIDRAQDAAASVWRFWHLRGQMAIGRAWLERLVALPGD